MILKTSHDAIDEIPNCEQTNLTPNEAQNPSFFSIDSINKDGYYFYMQQIAYTTAYLHTTAMVHATIASVWMRGATASKTTCVFGKTDARRTRRQFGMNT